MSARYLGWNFPSVCENQKFMSRLSYKNFPSSAVLCKKVSQDWFSVHFKEGQYVTIAIIAIADKVVKFPIF